MFGLGLLSSVAYWPGWSGAATTPRWAVLFLTVPWLLKPGRIGAPQWLWVAFVSWSAVTILWAPVPIEGIGALFPLMILGACLFLGTQLNDLRTVIIGAGIGIWVSSGFAIVQSLGFHPFVELGQGRLPAGLFVNGNYMTEAAALVLVAAVSERLFWLIPGLLPALLIPHARGALLAAVVALLAYFRSRTVTLVSMVALGVWAVFNLRHGSDSEHLAIWHLAAANITLFGHGIGSFEQLYPYIGFAHNEFLHFGFELGLVGFAIFSVFCLSLIGPMDTSRVILLALLVESCFAFPLHLPTTAFLGAIAAGHAVRTRYILCDLSLSRGRIRAARMAGEIGA